MSDQEKEPPPGPGAGFPVESILLACLAGPKTDWDAKVEKACRDHPDLADALRHAYRIFRGLGTRPGQEQARRMIEEDGVQDLSIRQYVVRNVLGRGGMGIVYLAEQQGPVRRPVALKVIKLGMDSEQVLRRFESERQAVALMEHSNIAKVFDAGTTDRGQPYFAMEYVKGLPITDHCDRQHLSIEERLELFRQVCSGVQHAHQKGVIHRDLKPSNVLVGIEEGKPVPKIIDFGLARATDHQLVQATVFTEQGQVIGTPEYMSPEQAGLGGQDVDTRTDVYSLGVLLYELLVGELPFPSEELRRAGLGEMERRIKEDEPPKPSTRLSSRNGTGEAAARRRRTDTRTLLRRLRTDLDWVVMKALEKDRRRRYDTPAALAEDLRRHLDHEAVLAGPPSVGYRTRKFLRRYRGQVVAAAAVLLTAIVGTVVAVSYAISANENARVAQDNLDDFNLLSNVVKLREAKAAEQELHPPWPDRAEAMRTWLSDQAEPLERELPVVQQAIEDLRARARPVTEAAVSAWIEASPRYPELTALRNKRSALEKAQAVRAGTSSPEVAVLEVDIPEDARGLNEIAWPLVSWNESERAWGSEAEGLALARRAWDRAKTSPDAGLRAMVADTLAWALFANGLDERAVEMSETALTSAPADQRMVYQSYLRGLNNSIAAFEADGGAAALATVTARVSSLEAELSASLRWRFDEPGDQFLHDALVTLASDLTDFAKRETGELARVRDRLAWAEELREMTITAHEAMWDAAREAILNPDGETASVLYASSTRLDLQPQLGLVPIGMNPVTRLWEFYHLRSAADPSVIPVHDPVTGHIEVTAETGIIFVLLPGGSFTMGSQSTDPAKPNYDPLTFGDLSPREVTVQAFFIARHEMTQAQWERLSLGERPSQHGLGYHLSDHGAEPVTASHPVEGISWDMAHDLLLQHGLELPSDAEWEYACRANTTTPWSTGTEAISLVGFANILDETAAASQPQWGRHTAGLNDGFVIHAPVGSFEPNDFGLFDMHGNVWEWSHDFFDASSTTRAARGGSFSYSAEHARSANRVNYAPAIQNNILGVRPSRAVH